MTCWGPTSEVAQRQPCGLSDYLSGICHLSSFVPLVLWRSQQPGAEQIQEAQSNLAL